ncbi:VWA domain-containing protein [Rhizobium sp. L1K21]|uniref:vWA domain-containing protein n=1 Tax=Rhizobium sp. L1K21 TaxID=2954933 RepID=UPI0020933CF8|nr:VWA domain-containing protein [Rhizobium sp. L1K21]MCO6185004.1 VWA domain-containing protein [Rhizobium sp. L1K21]
MNATNLKKQINRLHTDKGGNFAIIAALLLPVIIFGVGSALDTSYMLSTRLRLQTATDAAATAAATALVNNPDMTLDEAETLAMNYVKSEMLNSNSPVPEDCVTAKATETKGYGTERSYDVSVNACADYSFSGLSRIYGGTGSKVKSLSAAHGTTGTQNALSMFLVLDRSGSMNETTDTEKDDVSDDYICDRNSSATDKCISPGRGKFLSKMDSLKLASMKLLHQIETADPSKKYARMGAVSYTNWMWTPENLNWGTDHITKYVKDLSANGGTDSSDAMEEAYTQLTRSSENNAHLGVNGKKPSKFIVFMTDGANNYWYADWWTLNTCDKAKKAGIEIYTVAFQAPYNGQQLLSSCASDSSHYFNAQSAEEMVAAFEAIGAKAADRMTVLTQ